MSIELITEKIKTLKGIFLVEQAELPELINNADGYDKVELQGDLDMVNSFFDKISIVKYENFNYAISKGIKLIIPDNVLRSRNKLKEASKNG